MSGHCGCGDRTTFGSFSGNMGDIAGIAKAMYFLSKNELREYGKVGDAVAFILPDGSPLWAPGGSHDGLIKESTTLMDEWVQTLDESLRNDDDALFEAMDEGSVDPVAWFLEETKAVRNGGFGEVGGMKASGTVDFEFGGPCLTDITWEQAALMVTIMLEETTEDGVKSLISGVSEFEYGMRSGAGADLGSVTVELRKPSVQALWVALCGGGR